MRIGFICSALALAASASGGCVVDSASASNLRILSCRLLPGCSLDICTSCILDLLPKSRRTIRRADRIAKTQSHRIAQIRRRNAATPHVLLALQQQPAVGLIFESWPDQVSLQSVVVR